MELQHSGLGDIFRRIYIGISEFEDFPEIEGLHIYSQLVFDKLQRHFKRENIYF